MALLEGDAEAAFDVLSTWTQPRHKVLERGKTRLRFSTAQTTQSQDTNPTPHATLWVAEQLNHKIYYEGLLSQPVWDAAHAVRTLIFAGLSVGPGSNSLVDIDSQPSENQQRSV